MISDSFSAGPGQVEAMVSPADTVAAQVHPQQIGVREFASYALVIDARSPHEFAQDHVPGAVNLPVVDDAEFAEVGIRHKTDQHSAYLVGVAYSLRNIADQIKPLISRYTPQDRFLVYCFRGGKRSRLWADNLRTIGFEVDVLSGGWKSYRRWVREGLDTLSRSFSYRVLCGPTGSGKTRLLHELRRQGQQVLELEELAHHRGSLLGDLPDDPQPTQKLFDSALLAEMRKLDPGRVVWVEAESKKIGNLQLPESLHEAMHGSPVVNIDAPMAERVKLWREDYPHFALDPQGMVRKLEPLKPLVGKETLSHWMALAADGRVDELFESVMVQHYDPCYRRSTRRSYGTRTEAKGMTLESLRSMGLAKAVRQLVAADCEIG
ncbi:MAG: tRNA 2-selenouridine(34) synthase MnmH [Burkholderiaceae bacterium]|nr:tRNA 2-selenouridine(34) synthase MnmH [Burkholderiaceae bacterium]